MVVVVLSLVWGSTWWVIREGLRDLPPFTSAALRFALAAVLMVPVAAVLGRREGGGRPPPRLVLLHGTLNFALSYAVVYRTEVVLPSALTSILWAVYPLFQALLAHLLLPGERLRPIHAVGFLCAFLGVVTLFLGDIGSLGPGATRAAALLLLSPAAVAVATTVVKRDGREVSSLLLNRDALFVGAVLLASLALVTERERSWTLTPRAAFSVLYLALVGTVFTFGLLFWALRRAAATRLAVIPFLTPVVAVTIGRFGGGERVTPWTVCSLLLIAAGVFVVSRARFAAVPGSAAVSGRPPPPGAGAERGAS